MGRAHLPRFSVMTPLCFAFAQAAWSTPKKRKTKLSRGGEGTPSRYPNRAGRCGPGGKARLFPFVPQPGGYASPAELPVTS